MSSDLWNGGKQILLKTLACLLRGHVARPGNFWSGTQGVVSLFALLGMSRPINNIMRHQLPLHCYSSTTQMGGQRIAVCSQRKQTMESGGADRLLFTTVLPPSARVEVNSRRDILFDHNFSNRSWPLIFSPSFSQVKWLLAAFSLVFLLFLLQTPKQTYATVCKHSM